MKYLIVYYNNTTKEFYNEIAYGATKEIAINNFKHYPQIGDNDKIINVIQLEL